ncbi:hypothetical protein EOA27_22945 [Mesorhizobium sp. M2A.F.Ca.ET.037.01.1.1]|uniref:hypothetical protein n=1 Tax=unclassified Mesorhizobium TaxID=325217 RepID=UPI000F761EA9|nr:MULTISPECIES: hypothetical protein [unclassified Mesorhizobium]RUX94120.1 hypothetical protein EOA25_30370 [Mesorhizobium sp. M2A.F.Ca.ET.040.01.1.1]RVC63834.1 hypothetical protein EN759_25405 [Mesorhizobium sp. M00.F.Ca.ET.038.03.1.1]RVC77522.1 hypothetical protein EN766_11405 [Mesorhizobium sp. M2A.F.Ca.ET.046.02.1.1]AZO02664.1 hypothetical protein EJ068_05875 [Mesorhizobium sp. M2A.F.Ca.ET.043.02.1.1]AZO37255.1 hypothetical protein EJ072_24630 [Mesorhizobium sp. M2A.F.Ca.ET.046.03.2.1]
MRQHMLNGWLVAALIALVCLLGVTAYVEISKDLPRVACVRDPKAIDKKDAQHENCSTPCCTTTAASA